MTHHNTAKEEKEKTKVSHMLRSLAAGRSARMERRWPYFGQVAEHLSEAADTRIWRLEFTPILSFVFYFQGSL